MSLRPSILLHHCNQNQTSKTTSPMYTP
ncbi:unnamed protein product [Chondrus crispus]|uniref:Uncharacterized protein n=1 Tax=Chondrus crispus TaxID=2769 RepID=R7QL34_CHOCR|nr:unnamed protein product [Chondrus crispus]CDF38100.1 unnamed protein product [Chondrus crispus]|eukprot:XP_005717969.1 unnamed protein product [Chondrus crispus]